MEFIVIEREEDMITRKALSVKRLIDKNKRVIIHGLPGLGKTSIALRMTKMFKVCVHFDCAVDYPYFNNIYQAYKKGFQSFVDLMVKYSEVNPFFEESYLFVFDNIDCSDFFREKIYPIFKKHDFNLLMTMRSKNKSLNDIINDSVIYTLYPVSYKEFFDKCDGGLPEDIITGHISMGKEVPRIIHDNCNRILEDYVALGGLPEAVNAFFTSESVEEEVKFIHEKYRFYSLEKLLENADIDETCKYKCRQICDSMLKQMLEDDYNKFIFSRIREGITYKKYEDAIQFLIENNYLIKVDDLSRKNCFKLFFYDCGILLDMLLHRSNGREFNKEFKDLSHIIYQNFLIQELVKSGYKPTYWKSAYTAVVDAIIDTADGIIAFKIFSDDDLRDKSLDEYSKFAPKAGLFKLSQENLVKNKKYFNLPFYAISCVELKKFQNLFLNVVD